MTRSGIFGATALSLSLLVAAPVLAQESHMGRANAHVSGTMGGTRASAGMNANTNFRGPQTTTMTRSSAQAQFSPNTQTQFAPRSGQAQFAQRGEFRGDRYRDRDFRRGAGFVAGAAVGTAIAAGDVGYGGYGYYDPYYAGSYAYDDSYAYDTGVPVVAFDQPEVAVETGPVVAEGVDASYCARRYRSYDPASGTYLGYDGLRHPCM